MASSAPVIRWARSRKGVAKRPVGAETCVENGGVEGLVVLPPADRTDEALVPDEEFEAAQREGDRSTLESRRRLIQRGGRRVGDRRAVADAIVESSEAEVPVQGVVAHRGHVFRFEQEGEAAKCLRLQFERRAQGRGERSVVEGVFVDLLDPIAKTDRDVAVADRLAEGCGLGRRSVVVALGERCRAADCRHERQQDRACSVH